MYLTVVDSLYLTVVSIFGTSGICCNIVLLYLIAWQSPSYLTPYRIFLGNTAITQLLFSAVFMLVAPRIISYDLRIVVVYLGPVQYFGPWWSYIMLIVLLHFAVNSFISIMLSMLFRWLCLRSLRFPTEAAIVMCFLGYVIPFTMVVSAPYMTTVSDAGTNDEYINYTVPDLHKYATAVGTEVIQAPMLYVSFQITVFLIPIYCIMYYSRWKIYRLIDKRRSFFQHQTTNCHIRLLVQALTVQSIIPLVSTFPASTMFLLGQSGLISTYTYSYVIIPCLSISGAKRSDSEDSYGSDVLIPARTALSSMRLSGRAKDEKILKKIHYNVLVAMVLPTLALFSVIFSSVLFLVAVGAKILTYSEDFRDAPNMPTGLYQVVRVAGEKEIENNGLKTAEYPNCSEEQFIGCWKKIGAYPEISNNTKKKKRSYIYVRNVFAYVSPGPNVFCPPSIFIGSHLPGEENCTSPYD